MKALTFTEPWGTLVALGLKKYETRSWGTAYRGLLMIHLAKSMPAKAREAFGGGIIGELLARDGIIDIDQLPLGHIVALACLEHCHEITATFASNQDKGELAMGDFTPGRYAWTIDKVAPLPEPIPAKGALSLWTPTIEVVRAVTLQLSSARIQWMARHGTSTPSTLRQIYPLPYGRR